MSEIVKLFCNQKESFIKILNLCFQIQILCVSVFSENHNGIDKEHLKTLKIVWGIKYCNVIYRLTEVVISSRIIREAS